MILTEYEFRHEWSVPARVGDVYDVLVDIGLYPCWWPQVRAVVRAGEERVLLVCRSVLPYSLEFVASRRREDPVAGVLEAELSGDLDGWARWSLSASEDAASSVPGTRVVYEQQVVTTKRLLRVLAPVARPALRANHAWMMRAGERGLRQRVTTRGHVYGAPVELECWSGGHR
jgi:hypothetical protein